MASTPEKRAYVTLVTRPSYLTGVIILAYSLNRTKTKYPLVVLITPTLGEEATRILELEAKQNPTIIISKIEPLIPREANTGSAASRFQDTYTKLRAFQLHGQGYTKCVFLDADMAIFQCPDDLFSIALPSPNWIAANHACVCNLDFDAFAPPSWTKSNCAYTPLTSPLEPPTPITPSSRPTYHLLNSGMFLYHPTPETWTSILHEFHTSPKIKTYAFPDQDFLIDFFRNRWTSLSWKYNALKTMRSWHPRMYSDEHVVVLHYIVDKPWERRIASDGIAGHLGRDGFTHRQWWDIYQEWYSERSLTRGIGKDGDNDQTKEIARLVDESLPPNLDEKSDSRQVEENLRYEASSGKKVAWKPFGTPPGEAEDVKEWVAGEDEVEE